jgi:hypothetical protein
VQALKGKVRCLLPSPMEVMRRCCYVLFARKAGEGCARGISSWNCVEDDNDLLETGSVDEVWAAARKGLWAARLANPLTGMVGTGTKLCI